MYVFTFASCVLLKNKCGTNIILVVVYISDLLISPDLTQPLIEVKILSMHVSDSWTANHGSQEIPIDLLFVLTDLMHVYLIIKLTGVSHCVSVYVI